MKNHFYFQLFWMWYIHRSRLLFPLNMFQSSSLSISKSYRKSLRSWNNSQLPQNCWTYSILAILDSFMPFTLNPNVFVVKQGTYSNASLLYKRSGRNNVRLAWSGLHSLSIYIFIIRTAEPHCDLLSLNSCISQFLECVNYVFTIKQSYSLFNSATQIRVE